MWMPMGFRTVRFSCPSRKLQASIRVLFYICLEVLAWARFQKYVNILTPIILSVKFQENNERRKKPCCTKMCVLSDMPNKRFQALSLLIFE